MKNWYQSKTLWVNAIAIVAIVSQAVTGREVIPAETQGMLLAIINFVLRLITKEEIS